MNTRTNSLSILSVLTILALLASTVARADSNPELELASIAEQAAVKPLVERICIEVQYSDTTYTEMKCSTIVGAK